MTIPTLRHPASAWRFILDALRALTQPRVDVAECDRRVAALAADSAFGRAALASNRTWRRVLAGSAGWRAWANGIHALRVRPLADRIRAIAIVAVAAAATVLLLRPLTTEPDPLTWMVPIAVAAAAAVAWALADAIARAIEHYHS
jgi:hypothetical protein